MQVCVKNYTLSPFLILYCVATAACTPRGRFTVSGDTIMVTDFEENPVAPLILETGRRLFVLVSDTSKKEEVEKQLDAACTAAMGGGWFAEIVPANVHVGGVVLPSCVPKNNHPEAVVSKLRDAVEDLEDDDEGPLEDVAALDTAKHFADEEGLEIKVPTYSLFFILHSVGQHLTLTKQITCNFLPRLSSAFD